MSDYTHAKTENLQKLLDNSLKKQKQELISGFLEKLESIHECNSLSCVEIRCNEYREEYQEK